MTTPSGPPPTQPPTTERRDRPPRSAPRIGDDGRRLSTAGHALVVCALALVFAALLTAPGMHKSAFNRQPGTQRDVALALTAPLADVSHALLLDRPRHLLQSAIGRGSADEIDTAIELPPATTGTTATTPGTTSRRHHDDGWHDDRPCPHDPGRRRGPSSRSRRKRSCGSGSQAIRS